MILLYHLIFPDDTPERTWNAGKVLRLADFQKQLSWVNKRYRIVPLEEYIQCVSRRKNLFTITFDDGYLKTIDLVLPFLQHHNIPATFFLNTSHLEDGKLLWFVYINALCFERIYDSLEINFRQFPLHSEKECFTAWKTLIHQARSSHDPIGYSEALSTRYPLSELIRQKYSGVTEEQIASIGKSKLFTIGSHTHSHPYLDQLSYSQLVDEILQNKQILESSSGREINYFAYPGGVYNSQSVEIVKSCGFQAGLALTPHTASVDTKFEIPRTGIYSASMLKFALKIYAVPLLSR